MFFGTHSTRIPSNGSVPSLKTVSTWQLRNDKFSTHYSAQEDRKMAGPAYHRVSSLSLRVQQRALHHSSLNRLWAPRTEVGTNKSTCSDMMRKMDSGSGFLQVLHLSYTFVLLFGTVHHRSGGFSHRSSNRRSVMCRTSCHRSLRWSLSSYQRSCQLCRSRVRCIARDGVE